METIEVIKTKVCEQCTIEKSIDDFPKNGKYIRNKCKKCTNNNKIIWDENNPDYQKNYMKQYRDDNSEDIKKDKKKYYDDNKEKYQKIGNDYYANNKEKCINNVKKRTLERLKTDPQFKLTYNIRTLIRNAFAKEYTPKAKKTTEILGCTFEEFKKHLENKFAPEMNWENQGSYWVMDHITPVSLAKTEQELILLNHYTNFQPLTKEANRAKSDTVLE